MAYEYTVDRSADESRKIVTDGLLPDTIYWADGSLLRRDPIFEKDATRFVVSFQGLLNREYGQSHTSLLYLDVTQSDDFWFDYTRRPGKSFHGMAVRKIADLTDFFALFAPQLADFGLIEWDPAVPATANVAATICGLDGMLPVRHDPAPDSFETLALGRGLTVKQSLVGMFGPGGTAYEHGFTSCGSAKNDAYRWAYDKYFARCSSRYIAYILDGAGCVPGTPFEAAAHSAGLNCLYNHDYYLARRCFFFDLTCIDIEKPCDDPDQPLGTDLATLKMIMKGRYDRANGAFGQILGFPPWWVKYTTSRGMGSLFPTTVEWIYVALVTAYNLAKEADAAHPCTMSNASFYSRYTSSFKQYKNNRPTQKKRFDPKVKYFTFYGGDYDSAAWLKQHVANFWVNDDARGKIPINWSFNPNLSERAPMVFDFIHEEMTPNDFFSAGDSGAGYVIPAALSSDSSLREVPDGCNAWAEYSKWFYEKFDLDVTGFIINGHYPMTRQIMEMFASFSPVGNFHNCSNTTMALCNGVPFVYLHNGVSGRKESAEGSAKAMLNHFRTRMAPYNFAGFRNVCDAPSDTLRLVETFLAYAKEQDPETRYEYVDTYTFFDLVMQSGQCTEEL